MKEKVLQKENNKESERNIKIINPKLSKKTLGHELFLDNQHLLTTT